MLKTLQNYFEMEFDIKMTINKLGQNRWHTSDE